MTRCRRVLLQQALGGGVALIGIAIFLVDFFLLTSLDNHLASSSGPVHQLVQGHLRQAENISIGEAKPQTNVEGKAPLLKTLREAGVENWTAHVNRLPTWQQVVNRFGDKPRILGLETCEGFRHAVDVADRKVGPAGTFNTGTNLLATMIQDNCFLPSRGKDKRNHGMFWQTNWGKHTPASFHDSHKAYDYLSSEHFMTVVVTRDPYTWMQSMCRVRYSAHWYHVVEDDQHRGIPFHCPNLIPNNVDREWFNKTKAFVREFYRKDPWKVDNLMDKANYTLDSTIVPVRVRYKASTVFHESLIDMWVDWYMEYKKFKKPRLIIRLEDLVYHPKKIVSTICSCVGGELADKLTLTADSVKQGADNIHGTVHTDLAEAMVKHVKQDRKRGMTKEDLAYVSRILQGKGSMLMEQFGYSIDP